jgi:hypothetical protein
VWAVLVPVPRQETWLAVRLRGMEGRMMGLGRRADEHVGRGRMGTTTGGNRSSRPGLGGTTLQVHRVIELERYLRRTAMARSDFFNTPSRSRRRRE